MAEATVENQGSYKVKKIEGKKDVWNTADSGRNVAELLNIVLIWGW